MCLDWCWTRPRSVHLVAQLHKIHSVWHKGVAVTAVSYFIITVASPLHCMFRITYGTIIKIEPPFLCPLGSHSRVLCSKIHPLSTHIKAYANTRNFTPRQTFAHRMSYFCLLFSILSNIRIFLVFRYAFPIQTTAYRSVLLGVQRHRSSITLASPNNSS